MGIHRGPNTVKDDLVFGYDTGDGVADNSTATRFYPGESTINLIPSSAATGTGNFSRSSHHNEGFTYSNVTNYRGRANVHRLYINPSGNTAAPYADYGGQYYKSGGSVVGDVYAISFDFYVAKGNNSPSLSTAYANGYKSPTNAGAASITANSDVDLENGWTRRTRIATITIAGNTHWRFGLNTGGNETEAYLDNVQIELKSHATPFIDGTRSSTASLIDLKRTTNIDVSNVSFDSTGQPDFDGTGDFIKASSTHSITGDITLEGVFNEDTSSSPHTTVICTDTGHQYGVKLMSYKNSNRYGLWLGFGSSSYVAMHAGTLDNNTTYHLVGSWEQSTGVVKIYLNGVLKSTLSTGQTSAISLNEAKVVIGADYHSLSYGLNGKVYVGKVYQKVLTATEVKQNYNAYKNRFDI
jgi:hypothetical protein